MSENDAYSVDKIHKSFQIIIDEIDDSIDWIFGRLETYSSKVVHEFNYTLDVATAYRKKVKFIHSDLTRSSNNIANPEIKQVYVVNLGLIEERLDMLDEILSEYNPLIAYQDVPKYYS